MIIVSACLLGKNCKYNGGNNRNEKVIAFLKDKEYMALCPEQLGGLPTPRLPCERIKDKVLNNQGEDKTKAFYLGTQICMEKSKDKKIDLAILKAKSPSCGKGIIYDGSFSSTLIKGNGVFVDELLKEGIKIITEDELSVE